MTSKTKISEQADEKPDKKVTLQSSTDNLDTDLATEHLTLGQGNEDADDPLADAKLNTLADIHRTFSNVIKEFRGDKSAERFMQEYEKLYEALKKTHRDMKAMQYKCANLQSEIKNNTEKVTMAIHLSQEDRGMIYTLNRQMQEAWALVDVMGEREAKSKAAVLAMKEEIQVLTSLVEEGMGMEELQMLADRAKTERAGLEEKVKEMKEEMDMRENKLTETIAKGKEREQQLDNEIKDLKHALEKMLLTNDEVKAKYDTVMQQCNKLNRQNKRLIHEKGKLELDIDGWKLKLKKNEEGNIEVQRELQRQSKSYRILKEENNASNVKIKTLKEKIERLSWNNHVQSEKIDQLKSADQKLKTDIEEKSKELKMCGESNFGLSQQLRKLSCALESLQSMQANCENDRKIDEGNMKSIQKSLTETTKALDALGVKHKSLTQNYESLQRTLLKTNVQKDELQKAFQRTMTANSDLLSEVRSMNETVKRVTESMSAMVTEKERLLRKINYQVSMVMQLEEDNLTKENLMLMADKARTEKEHTLKLTQESLVKSLHERDNMTNALRKHEIFNTELRNANANMLKQIKSLTESLTFQERKSDRLDMQKKRLKDEMNDMHAQLQEAQLEIKRNKLTMRELRKDNHDLQLTLSKRNLHIDQMQLYIEQIISQRNILGLQCVRKKEEVKMLTEKNQVLGDIMHMGNKLYNARLEEIAGLQYQNSNLLRQKGFIMKKVENVDNYKSKLGLANRQLVQYQAKCKAMEEDARTNIHHWRHLEADDQSKFEMVLKIQHLTKRLIFKSEQVAGLESKLLTKALQLQQQEKRMRGMPNQDIVQRALQDRRGKEQMKRKLQVALAEVNLVEWKAQEREEERNNLRKKLNEEQKKRLQQQEKYKREKEKGLLPRIPLSPMAKHDDPSGLQLTMNKIHPQKKR